MRNDNLKIGRYLAHIFNKKVGVITYSGTLAIELALLDCNLPPKTGVIVSSEVCSSIINTIVKLGLTPIIISPKKDLIITNEDIIQTINKSNINCGCILLVHQYGLANNISKIKKDYPDIKIIEDIAQAWDIRLKNTCIGEYSDYIVTSFGKTKPLSYGIAGAIITDRDKILSKTDFCDNESRESNDILYSYAYPLCCDIDIKKIIKKANEIVLIQRTVAKYYSDLFENNSYIHFVKTENENTWHRFPIWIKEKKYYNYFINLLDICEIEYQLPHAVKNEALPIIKKHSIVYNYSEMQGNLILLRTRIFDIEKFSEKLFKLKELLNNKV